MTVLFTHSVEALSISNQVYPRLLKTSVITSSTLIITLASIFKKEAGELCKWIASLSDKCCSNGAEGEI